MNSFYKKFDLPKKQGNGFFLIPIEIRDYIDFTPKRIYYITDITSSTGQHCHYEEKELFVMVRGNCTAIIDRGQGREEIPFESGQALYTPNYVWHGFSNFSDDAILMAITSTNYDPERKDYLEDYDRYLEIRDEKLKEEYDL